MHVEVRTSERSVEFERNRRRGIENICKANKIDDNLRDYWIGTGLTIEQLSDDLLKVLEERGKTNPKTDTSIGLTEKEARSFSLFNAIRAVVDKNWSNAGFELEASRAVAQKLGRMSDAHKFFVPFEVQQSRAQGRRDLTAGTSSAGGYLVSTENMSFIELMRNRSVVYNMGARRLAGLVGNVTVPKQSAAGTAVWLANEASTVTESAQTFGQMSLSPKTVGGYTEISRQLLLQSSPDAEGIVKTDLATICALAIDVGALRGSGASGEPQGIVGTSGVGSVTGTSLAAAGILEFQSDVSAGNLLSGSCGYVTTPAVAALLMARPELPSTGTTRLWQGNMLEGTLFNMRAMTSNQMSSATMLFGDFSQVVIGEWGVLELEVNPYANFQAGIVGVRALVSIDVGVRYGGAFSYASSIT
jgi:HK97 family phage major capsid protein